MPLQDSALMESWTFLNKSVFSSIKPTSCRHDIGEYALIEMQACSHHYWDRRVLAYVAAFYGNQLSRGDDWKHIRKVIGINILGDAKKLWSHALPGVYMRDNKSKVEDLDQLNGNKDRLIDVIELLQYSIMKAPNIDDKEKQDWITFFKRAAYMIEEEEVEKEINTPAVKIAFERAKIDKLPSEVRTAYEAQDKEFDNYSDHTTYLLNKTENEVRLRVAKNLISSGMDDDFIEVLS